MKKRKEKIILSLLTAAVFLLGIGIYGLYIRTQFYQESTRNLLETYEQVNKTFTMFAQRNWNMLNGWGKSLQNANREGRTFEILQSFEPQRDTWHYSDVYLFSQDCQYVDTEGNHDTAAYLAPAFAELYRTGTETVSSYTTLAGDRRVVFAVPIEPVQVNGIPYTCLVVSYRNEVLEELIGGHSYGGQSDCYIVYADGDIMLTEEPKSEIEARMVNLFDYLAEHTVIKANDLEKARQGVADGGSGSLAYRYGGKGYYLVYRPVGFQQLSIIGIVDRSVVDAGMRKIQNATILLLAVLFFLITALVVWSTRTTARLRVEEKERELRRQETERRKMEGLANTDGLTGLYNERCFNEMLKRKEEAQEPFALFYLDLDKFKPVNDLYGHDMGDQLLKAVARRLHGCVRASDAVFRIGGDEFALIVNGNVDEAFCRRRTQKIKETIRVPYVLDGHSVEVDTSCGCALYPAECRDVREVRILADRRMYEDKTGSGQSRSR